MNWRLLDKLSRRSPVILLAIHFVEGSCARSSGKTFWSPAHLASQTNLELQPRCCPSLSSFWAEEPTQEPFFFTFLWSHWRSSYASLASLVLQLYRSYMSHLPSSSLRVGRTFNMYSLRNTTLGAHFVTVTRTVPRSQSL